MMADYERRIERIEREAFVLASPTNWAEVQKVFAAAQRRLEGRGVDRMYDDSVVVEAIDDEVWFRLPDRPLEEASRAREEQIRATVIAELREWLASGTETVGGPQTAGDVLRLLASYDPNNPPFGVAKGGVK